MFSFQVDLEPDELERRIQGTPITIGGEKTDITQTFVNPRNMRLTPMDFELKKVLGKGGYGKVFLVKVRNDPWTITSLKCDPSSNSNQVNRPSRKVSHSR